MNEETNEQLQVDANDAARSQETHPKNRLIAITAIALILVVAVAAWLLWPKQTGKPVPAPRSVSFEKSPQPATATGQKLTLTPEQMRSVQLKIETVGERPSS